MCNLFICQFFSVSFYGSVTFRNEKKKQNPKTKTPFHYYFHYKYLFP